MRKNDYTAEPWFNVKELDDYAKYMAHVFTRGGRKSKTMCFYDFRQAAWEIIMDCASKYDPTSGRTFKRYCQEYMFHRLLRVKVEQSLDLRIPSATMQTAYDVYVESIKRVASEFGGTSSRDALADAIAESEISETTFVTIRAQVHGHNMSFDLEADDGSRVTSDGDGRIAYIFEATGEKNSSAVDMAQSSVEDVIAVRQWVTKTLSSREADIIRKLFGMCTEHTDTYCQCAPRDPMTLQEIGDSQGVSKERIRQISDRALNKLLCDMKESGDVDASHVRERLPYRG